jgi:hypothetical protein
MGTFADRNIFYKPFIQALKMRSGKGLQDQKVQRNIGTVSVFVSVIQWFKIPILRNGASA